MKVLRYKATGIFDTDRVTLADVRLTYDTKGRLTKKQAYYLPKLYHTIATDLKYFYNINEQLVYETGSWDGGEYHNFYSYKKKTADTPNYELSFSWQGTDSSIYATLYH